MTASNRSFRGRSSLQHGRAPLGVQSENAGNRRTFDEVRIPPDNIGNKLEVDPGLEFIHDGMGNSLEGEPTHLKSGIMARLTSAKNQARRRHNDIALINRSERSRLFVPAIDPEEYFARLKADFAKLLGTKTGLAFSFSMKPISNEEPSWEEANDELEEVQELIGLLLEANSIFAEVSLIQYQTAAHRFAVFFIKPEESDPVKNKELIAALRQVISNHAGQMVKAQVNIFLVLANAQAVIEEHLYKIGAEKVTLKD